MCVCTVHVCVRPQTFKGKATDLPTECIRINCFQCMYTPSYVKSEGWEEEGGRMTIMLT